MITADLHTHTLYSHGKDTPAAMFAAAQAKGITLYGFTEHSPRPPLYTYTREYRDQLTATFPTYVQEVKALQAQYPGQVLLGMEMDWMETETDFIKTSVTAYDFDYIIGSVHFLGTWGYDDVPDAWTSVRRLGREEHYVNYFKTMELMIRSGFFNIVGHMDLIKIFSIDTFRAWIGGTSAQDLVAACLTAIKATGMAMEVSSAGLRKCCDEIYPGPTIMGLAADIGVDITFASDAHNVDDVAADFDKLDVYARAYGYDHSVWFCKGQRFARPF